MLQNFKKFSRSSQKDNMTDTITTKGLAYASLSTHDLAQLYYKQPVSATKLPRDFMINTLLVRDFGQSAYDQHAADLHAGYNTFITNLRGQLGIK